MRMSVPAQEGEGGATMVAQGNMCDHSLFRKSLENLRKEVGVRFFLQRPKGDLRENFPVERGSSVTLRLSETSC